MEISNELLCVVHRGNALIPLLIGGDGPDCDCLATWTDRETAYREADKLAITNIGQLLIFDAEDDA